MEHRDGSSEFAAPSADCVELDAGEGADGDGLDGGGPGRSSPHQHRLWVERLTRLHR